MWLGRFIDEPCNYPAFGADMYADFAELGREREVTDRKMLDWAGGVTAGWLAAALSYVRSMDAAARCRAPSRCSSSSTTARTTADSSPR